MRTFSYIYVNCCNGLTFLPQGSTKLAKMHFIVKNNNSERKHGNQTNDPIFSFIFSTLFVIFIFVFEFIFMWSLFNSFWSVKYCNFGQKLPIRIAHQTFLESKHSEVTKNSYYVLSPEGEPKKGISSWTNSDYLHKTTKIKDQANQRISV